VNPIVCRSFSASLTRTCRPKDATGTATASGPTIVALRWLDSIVSSVTDAQSVAGALINIVQRTETMTFVEGIIQTFRLQMFRLL